MYKTTFIVDTESKMHQNYDIEITVLAKRTYGHLWHQHYHYFSCNDEYHWKNSFQKIFSEYTVKLVSTSNYRDFLEDIRRKLNRVILSLPPSQRDNYLFYCENTHFGSCLDRCPSKNIEKCSKFQQFSQFFLGHKKLLSPNNDRDYITSHNFFYGNCYLVFFFF